MGVNGHSVGQAAAFFTFTAVCADARSGVQPQTLELTEQLGEVRAGGQHHAAYTARAQTSVGEVFRLGAGLYDIATEAKEDGLKLALLKADHTFVTEIEGV